MYYEVLWVFFFLSSWMTVSYYIWGFGSVDHLKFNCFNFKERWKKCKLFFLYEWNCILNENSCVSVPLVPFTFFYCKKAKFPTPLKNILVETKCYINSMESQLASFQVDFLKTLTLRRQEFETGAQVCLKFFYLVGKLSQVKIFQKLY